MPTHRLWTVAELTEELRFPSPGACRKWLTRKGVPCRQRGRIKLFHWVDVERALTVKKGRAA